PMALPPVEQQVGSDSTFYHLGGSPFAGDGGVVAERPPEVVRKFLRAAVELPPPLHRESVVVDDKDTARDIPVRVAQGAHVDAIRAAMDRVRTAVAGPVGDLLSLDGVYELGVLRVGLDVEGVDA